MKIKILGIVFILFLSSFFLSGCTSSNYYHDDYDSYESDYEEPITSENWDCTGDCSGHEAGYDWASDNGISDLEDCGGNSDSFVEGCEAYANEYQQETEEYDDYEDNYYY